MSFSKKFCGKSPFKMRVGEIRKKERQLRRNDKRDRKMIENGETPPYEGNLHWFM